MAAAGVGEDGGLPGGPLNPDAAQENPSDPEILGGSPESAVTQLLPMVRRDPTTDSASVRAVARRQAAALPALGRDGPTEVPHSARITVDRRRQAAKAASPDSPHDNLPDSRPGELPDSPPGELASGGLVHAAPPVAAAPEPPRVVTPPLMGQPPADPAVAEPVARVERAPVVVAEIVETAIFGAAPIVETAPIVEAEIIEDTRPAVHPTGRHEAREGPDHDVADHPVDHDLVDQPEASPAGVAPGGPSRIAAAEDEFADDRPAPRPAGPAPVSRTAAAASMGAATAEMLSALTEVAFREARTDEWIVEPAMFEPAMLEPIPPEGGWFAPSAGPEPSSELALAEPRPGPLVALPLSSTALLEPVRTGPRMLDADSWDATPQPPVEPDYQGRRRAGVTSTRLWLVIGLVVVALSAAIAVPFLLTSGLSSPSTDRTPGGAVPPDVNSSEDISGMSSPGASPTGGSTGVPVGAASPAASSAAPSDSTSPDPGSSSSVPPAGFAPLTVQAEQGGAATAWGDGAGTVNFAGATVVDKLGDDWFFGRNGWLEFRNFTVPTAGTYKLAIYYVYTNQTPNSGTRRMQVSVNGSNVSSQNFTSVSSINTREQNVTLKAGPNTIRFTDSGLECPAIDKIVISKP